MAKKKHTPPSSPAEEPAVDSLPAEAPPSAEAQPEALGDLAGEVQSFLAQRDQLARKLREEIAVTERKLADLKKTAAALFPVEPPAIEPAPKDRKPKKPAAAKSNKADDGSSGPLFREPAANDEPVASDEATGSADVATADASSHSNADAEAQLGAAPHEPLID